MSGNSNWVPQSAWGDRIRALRNLPAALRILWESGPAVVTWGLMLSVVVAAMPWSIGWVASRIINGVDAVLHHQPLPSHFWRIVGAEIALALIFGALTRAIAYTDSLLADRYTHHVSIEVMRQGARLDLTTYEDPDFLDRLNRARAQAADCLIMIQQMGRLFLQVLTTLIWSTQLVYYSPWLMLLLIAGVLPSFFGETHFAFLGYAKNLRQTPVKRVMEYLRLVGGSKETAKELRLFNLSDYLTNRFVKLSEQIYRENVSFSQRKLFWGGLLSLLSTCGYFGTYVLAIWETLDGRYNVGIFYLITTAIQQASGNLQQAFSTVSGIAEQALFLNDLIGFFELNPVVQSKPNALSVPRPVRRGIEFRNVSFVYPATQRWVLKDFNFTIEPGQRIALVGQNGQGKTTVVKLITRLYDPTEGQILLDGIDLREYSLDDLHREMGVIFQDFVRYEMTVRENICVGHIEVLHTDAEIRAAAEKSLVAEVVKNLPGGYDQMLGRCFVSGVDLSGGEWQRIALARAYLRDAQLLILDEPTAALDAMSELQVLERFDELTAGKMGLLISHRFSTVRMAHRIVVLSGGRLVEEGTHEQLMALGGQYAEMFEMQVASYL